MRAARYHIQQTGLLRVDDVPEPHPGVREVRLRVAYCGICGSDLARYRQMSSPPPSLRDLLGPVSAVPGHEFVGVIDQLGSDVPPTWGDGSAVLGSEVVVHPQIACGECASCRSGYWTGCEQPDRIRLLGLHRDGGFAESVAVPFDHVVRIPTTLSLEHAALAEPLAVALRSVNLSKAVPAADSLCVMGDGPIGLLTARLLVQQGHADVTLVGRHEQRMQIAGLLGIERCLTTEEARARTGEQFNILFQTAGTQEALAMGFGLLARGGTMITGAYLHGDDPGLHGDLYFQMIRREKTLKGSCGYTYDELGEAVRLLAEDRIDAEAIISATIPLADIVERGFEALVGKEKAPGKILVQP